MVSHRPQICLVQHVLSSLNHLPELLIVDPPFTNHPVHDQIRVTQNLYSFFGAPMQDPKFSPSVIPSFSHPFPPEAGFPPFCPLPWAPQWPMRSHGSSKLGTSTSGSSCRATSATLMHVPLPVDVLQCLTAARALCHIATLRANLRFADDLRGDPTRKDDGRCCFKCWRARQRKTPNLRRTLSSTNEDPKRTGPTSQT